MAAIGLRGADVAKFVPGEVCVVCDVAAGAPVPDLNRAVRDWLNEGILAVLPRVATNVATNVAAGDAQGALERDLQRPLAELKRRFDGERQVLRPLPRARRGDPTPTVLLERPKDVRGGATTAFVFLRLGGPEQALEGRLRDVEGLVKLINRHVIADRDRRPPAPGVTVRAASPNWLFAGTANGDSGDSPGARPQAAPDGHWTLKLEDADADALARGRTEGGAVVAVLDTSPQRRDIEAATRRGEAAGNWLLQRLAGELDGSFFVDETGLSLRRDYINQRLDTFLVNWRDALQQGHSYEHPDHGLFVAGVVRDVAREAEIHLIRVLNDYGVGDLLSLTHVLRRLPELLKGEGQRRLVVNLSLGAEVWPGEHLLHAWLPETHDEVARTAGAALTENLEEALLKQGRRDVLRVLAEAHLALAEAVTWLREVHGALVVAAAGNDYDPLDPSIAGPPRQEPRFPARYSGVFGVAAVGPCGAAAQYSNRGDVTVIENGVATFGGQARRPAKGALPEIVEGEGFVGICSSGRLPIGQDGTENGWMTWAGTSFATPIITALAAKQWGVKTPTPQTPEDVIGAVRRLVATGGGTVPLDGDLATPTIRASQKDDPAGTGALR